MKTRQGREAVLLVGHGTVEALDDLPELLLRIRRGRAPSPELLGEIRRRYEAVGGSPLLEITCAQAHALEERLGRQVLVAMRFWAPTIEEALMDARAREVRRLCVLPAAPFSVHVYRAVVEAELERLRPRLGPEVPGLVAVAPWGSEPAFIRAHVERIRAARAFGDLSTEIVLTAHSLPLHTIRSGDPYAEQVQAAADAIAAKLGRPCRLAYQSQGEGGGEWLGPELRETLVEIRRTGARGVIVAPVGFLADHVETLYDLDIEAAGWARELGLAFERVPALNLAASLIEAMDTVVRKALS